MSHQALIVKLVHERHISVGERLSLPGGLAPRSDIAAVIRNSLQAGGQFPLNIGSAAPYSGWILFVAPGGRTLMHRAEVSLGNYATVASFEFTDVELAISAFVGREWPQGIDGVPIDYDA